MARAAMPRLGMGTWHMGESAGAAAPREVRRSASGWSSA
jgi:hypothetical protein